MQVERRKRIRILTLKNLGYASVAALLLLATANVISEIRGPKHGEFGRLLLKEEPAAVVVKQPDVVQEGEVPDVTPSGAAANLGVAPANVAPASVAPTILPTSPGDLAAGRIVGATQDKAAGAISIVGGPDGIRVEHAATDTAPKLSGGIFRQ
jgi:hypothetical protein